MGVRVAARRPHRDHRAAPCADRRDRLVVRRRSPEQQDRIVGEQRVQPDVQPVAGVEGDGRDPGRLAEHQRRLVGQPEAPAIAEDVGRAPAVEDVRSVRQPCPAVADQRVEGRHRDGEPRPRHLARRRVREQPKPRHGRPVRQAGDPGGLRPHADQRQHRVRPLRQRRIRSSRERDHERRRAAVPLRRRQHLRGPARARHHDRQRVRSAPAGSRGRRRLGRGIEPIGPQSHRSVLRREPRAPHPHHPPAWLG